MPRLLSYVCLNRRCLHQFDSWSDHPPCERCGGLRVQWLPKPVAIKSGATAQVDSDVRALADTYQMSDIKSARAGESVIPRPAPQPAAAQGPATTIEPVPGMRANVNWGSISCNAVTPQIPNEAPSFVGPRRKPPKLSDYTGRRYE